MLQYLDIAIGFAAVMLILSLIVTTLVHMVGVVLELRGKNLLRGVSKMVQKIVDLQPDEARKVANLVLNYDAVVNFSKKTGLRTPLSFLWAKPTKAITASEFIQLLEAVAKDPTLDPETQKALAALFKNTVPSVAGALQQAPLLAKKLSELMPGASAQVDEAVKQVAGRVRAIEAETAKWFDLIMDRSSDWFATKTRIVTVTVAVGFAIVLHIDTLRIVQQLSTNSDARTRLVLSADTLLKQADDRRTAGTLVGREALKSYADGFPDKNSKDAELLGSVPAEYVSCPSISGWLKKNEAGSNTVTGFEQACYNQAQKALEDDKKELQGLKERLTSSELEVIPSITEHWITPPPNPSQPSVSFRLGDFWKVEKARDGKSITKQEIAGRHILGVLMTAAFLSMGAPFWFNALKQLSSLRPMVAGKADKAAQAGPPAESAAAKAGAAGG